MSAPAIRFLPGFDGAALAVHEAGAADAHPVLLFHGLFSNAQTNWVRYGHAGAIAARGFRVIMPDLRAHGASAAPHDPGAYPDHVLVRDARALIDALDLGDHDLVGYSLGARTVAGLLATGAKPRRAVLAGMGLEGLSGWAKRRQFYLDALKRRDSVTREDPHFMAVMFLKSMKIDPVAAQFLLEADADVDVAALVDLELPIGVICGDEDRDNGSAPALADRLANATYGEVPGTHMSCITRPELGRAIAEFLAG